MKRTSRNSIGVFLIVGIACACIYWHYDGTSLPHGAIKLDNNISVKLRTQPTQYSRVSLQEMPDGTVATITSDPLMGQTLLMEVSEDSKVLQSPKEMALEFTGELDSLVVVYSADRQFAAIVSNNAPDLLALIDLAQREFESPMTIWAADNEALSKLRNQGRLPFSYSWPGPVRQRWNKVIDQLRADNPALALNWNCLN